MDIDVKRHSPVCHGKLTCFSVYCGPDIDFGGGRSQLWVDVRRNLSPKPPTTATLSLEPKLRL